MNIIRLFDKKTQKFSYKNKISTKIISDPKTLERIKSLKIPPAYTDVLISNNPSSKIQSIGTDTKKRKQYTYHQGWTAQQSKLKFNDLIIFGKKIKRIRKDIYANIVRCHSNPQLLFEKDCVISIVLYLIDYCNFRVGNEKYKKLYNSFGVTTLNSSHFKFNKNHTTIEFIGKKGVLNTNKVTNSNMCFLLKELCNSNDEYVFYYLDDKNNKYRITEKHINDFLKNYNDSLTVKMFRTWNANYMLLKELLNLELPDSPGKAKKNISIVIKKSASQMHHTSTVSKKSYMNSEIVDLYLKNPVKFKRLIEYFRKTNGNLPTINRLLNLILTHIQ
jgi:DNA topoisomerase-1